MWILTRYSGSGRRFLPESYPSQTMHGLIFSIQLTIPFISKSITGSIVTILRLCLIFRKSSYLCEGLGACETPSYRSSLLVSRVVPRITFLGKVILLKVLGSFDCIRNVLFGSRRILSIILSKYRTSSQHAISPLEQVNMNCMYLVFGRF